MIFHEPSIFNVTKCHTCKFFAVNQARVRITLGPVPDFTTIVRYLVVTLRLIDLSVRARKKY